MFRKFKRIISFFQIFFISIYFFFISIYLSKFILLNKKKIIFPTSFGFGDFILFYVKYYKKISNKKNTTIVFCKMQNNIVNYFFKKNSFLLLPFHISNRLVYLITSFNKKHIINRFNNSSEKELLAADKSNFTVRKKNFLLKFLDTNLISKELKKIFCKSTVSFYIKYYGDSVNRIDGSRDRATTNISKAVRIINFLLRKNFNVLVFGNNDDSGLVKLNNFYKKRNKKGSIYFFQDLSKEYSINDQVYAALKSKFVVSAGIGGFLALSFLLLKKKIIYDVPKIRKKNINNLRYNYYVYKKISINNQKYKIFEQNTNSYKKLKYLKYNIKEASYQQIIYKIKNFL
jgi:hypothetical protein